MGVQAYIDPADVQRFRFVPGNDRDIVDGAFSELINQSLQQRFAAYIQHRLGPVFGQVIQVVAAARRQYQCAALSGCVQVTFLRPQQFVRALQIEDAVDAGDAVFDAGQCFLFENFPAYVFHGPDGRTDHVVGPDNQADPGFPEYVYGCAVVFCRYDYQGAGAIPFPGEGDDFIRA